MNTRTPENLRAALDQCQLADLYRLRRQLNSLPDRGKSSSSRRQLRELERAVSQSVAACKRRRAAIPEQFSYPPELPFSAAAPQLVNLLLQKQVLVVAGDTGSGKTTQLPKICLQAGLGCRGLIGHTQPRRLAAISVARRLAEELGVSLGEGVGYQIRFTEKVAPATFIKLMTDGILLTEIQHDRYLNRYEVLIIDEAHERSLNIDFLLGYLKWLLDRRADLKLIITSATIDVDKFSSHFNDATVVPVSGRTFPVEVRYQPLTDGNGSLDTADLQTRGIISAVQEIQALDRQQQSISGDILVFLATERDIRDTAAALRRQHLADTEILPLYARLRQSEQVRIFQPHRGRRIVLATNVAETSLTVPGINYVIDTGLARISRYSLQSKVQRLPIEAISQASANQRMGRCGRVADGLCFRLYAQSDFESRPMFTDPEILRTNLAAVILRMLYLRLGAIDAFPFLEPPAPRAINDGFRLLLELGALNSQRQLTVVGRQMARLPVDPRYARMLVSADQERCLGEMLIIVSVLSIQDPREQGAENRLKAQASQQCFAHAESDFLTLVNLWEEYEQQRLSLSQSQLRKFCRQHHLSWMRMREWRELHRQLLLACQHLGFRFNRKRADYASVHKAIICGSLNQIAVRHDGKIYLGSRNRKLKLLLASVLSNRNTKWIVTGEQIETTRIFAGMAARIQPAWVEDKARHLVKRECFDPHWSKKRQAVIAWEKVSLNGLVLIERRAVPFAPLDRRQARSLFIQGALVEGEIRLDGESGEFLRCNAGFLDALSRQEEKLRKPGQWISPLQIAEFYHSRIPQDIVSTSELLSWLDSAGSREKSALMMDRAGLLGIADPLTGKKTRQQFPDQAAVHGNTLPISYEFKPGQQRDGATIEVPLAMLPQLAQADIDWAVPGILVEKCTLMIKSLPKSLRKKFIPISDFVSAILPHMLPGEGDFPSALSAQIRRLKKLDIPASQFRQTVLPQHLRIKLRVTDQDARELAFGEDVEAVKERLGKQIAMTERAGGFASTVLHELETSGHTDWDFGALPEQVQVGDKLVLLRYPALIDAADSVDIRLFAERSLALENHRHGLLRLYQLRSSQQRSMLQKQFSRFFSTNTLQTDQNTAALTEHAVNACYLDAFAVQQHDVRTREAFAAALNRGRQTLLPKAEQLESLLKRLFDSRQAIRQKLETLAHASLDYLLLDIQKQLQFLFCGRFIMDTPWNWLMQYPRYLEAVQRRLEKAPFLGPADQQSTRELQQLWSRYRQLCDGGHTDQAEAVDRIRWMIEEYRVSLFAQSLGTRLPISAKRLEKAMAALKDQTGSGLKRVDHL